MKFYSIAGIAAILLAGKVNAQHSSQKATIGIKGGGSLYTISKNSSGGAAFTSQPGIHAGLLAHIHLVPHLALQPEIVYSRQGAKGSGVSARLKNNLHYINAPILIQYMFDNGFRIQLGPQAGILVAAKQRVGIAPAKDIRDDFKTADLGLVGGISYVHPATGFGIDLRYNFGLTNINNISLVKETNKGGQLGLFYLFHHRH